MKSNQIVKKNEAVNPTTQSDSAWKRALECWFQPFLECFWPNIAKQIAWHQSIEEVSQEIQSLTTTSLVGKQIVDKLYKVHTKSSQHYMVLVHVEIQGDRENDFSKRLFEYCYKIYDRYQLPLVTLVVLSDDNQKWYPTPFELDAFGYTTIRYDFQAVKLLDWKDQKDELLKSQNPFKNLIAIYLEARATKHTPQSRLKIKMALFDHLLNQGWQKDDMLSFYTFLDGVMRLPKDLELQYHNHILETERAKNMNYITSAEQIGIEKGIEQGIAQGTQAGISQERHMIAKRMLQQGVNESFIASVTGLSEKEVQLLKETI